MTWTPISGAPLQYHTDSNDLASDYWLKFYTANTVTPFSVAIDDAGTSPQAKVKLNPAGYPISNPLDNATIFIPFVDQDYRMVMYKSEADADADNTGNAAFNVNPIPQDSAPFGDAEDIAMRETTLQIQDDYDRSPLFVDGEDFTAGVGPHVITVPAGWTPSNADTRFYKLDNSGIITPITPTSKDATTFTIAETLLSTDTLFIGDDKFRNQVDGDPADIRARISVYSIAQSDSQFMAKSANLSDVADAATARANIDVYSTTETNDGFQAKSGAATGFSRAETYYTVDDQTESVTVPISTGNVFVSVGPTGSGATVIWPFLDNIPTTAKYIRFRAVAGVSGPGATSPSLYFRARPDGTTHTGISTEFAGVGISHAAADFITDLGISGTAEIAVDANRVFDVTLTGNTGLGPTYTLTLYMIGFGV